MDGVQALGFKDGRNEGGKGGLLTMNMLEWRKSPDCISTVHSSLACTTRTIPYDPYLNCIYQKTMNQDEILLFCECRAARLSSNFVRRYLLNTNKRCIGLLPPKFS